MEQAVNPNIVPHGPGGLAGHIMRMIICVCTGGMAYPNTFVEGMDLTAIQQRTQGQLYSKDKGAASKSRF